MQFDRLVYRESGQPGRDLRVIVDFGIGEITAQAVSGGEVMWCRLAGHRGTVLRMKLAACDFGAKDEACTAPDGDGAGWSLELCRGEEPVKHLRGNGIVPEEWPEFASVIDLCFSFAEDRSIGQRAAQ